MSYGTIQQLLEDHLRAYVFAHPIKVAAPNRDFKAPEQDSYLKTHLMTNQPRAAGLGDDADDFWTGVFQIDVRGLTNQGTQEATDIVDGLRAHFKRGTRLSGDGVVLTVESAGVGPALESPDRFKLPVSINFHAYANPS